MKEFGTELTLTILECMKRVGGGGGSRKEVIFGAGESMLDRKLATRTCLDISLHLRVMTMNSRTNSKVQRYYRYRDSELQEIQRHT